MAKKCLCCSSFFSCCCSSCSSFFSRCCSSFFSCLARFSGNTHPLVDSCDLAGASGNTIPNACPEVPSSSFPSDAANVPGAAATEEADGRRHDPQTVPSATAPPSHDASSSVAAAEGASTSAVPTQDAPASGGSSSSFPTESDFINNIPRTAAAPSSSSPSDAANSNVSRAAATEEADGRRHDAQTAPPSQASTSDDASSSEEGDSISAVPSASGPPSQTPQASTSDDASSSSEDPSQASTAHHASSSSEEGASISAVPTSGGPSASFPTESDFTEKIRKAAADDKANSNVMLELLIQNISELLEFMKKNALDEMRSTYHQRPKSSFFLKLKEVLSEAIDAASSLQNITSILKDIGKAHWAAAGLLVVSYTLEKFETVSANRRECLGLLDEMYELAKYVKQLKERPRLRKGMENLIREAVEMIVKASLMCCVQINSSKFSRFFSASVDKEELLKFQAELAKIYKRMKNQFDICVYDAIACQKFSPVTPLAREYPKYAVGIEEPLEEVIELLEWQSEKKAVAVIVYGIGGVGKSTLADAVFARLDIVGCKYSMVRLFDDITSTPNIVELQKIILTDLMMGKVVEEKPEVRTFESGQVQIGTILQKEAAFIYIDNVLNSDRLQELLPRDMHKTKKLRVLITARDKSVRTGCRMETKVYAMDGLPRSDAMILLKKEMKKEMYEGELTSSQLNQIIEISGGIPKLLTVVARFISSEEDKQKAFDIVMEDKEHLEGQAFGDIEKYVFAYDYLPDRCKDPFLDICVFLKGMNWDSVEDILGKSELDMLEKRALVSKDRGMDVRVHDVILMIGNKRAEETRFNFTNATRSQLEVFLAKDIREIKGLWFGVYENPLDIPATKLDSMSNSLKILRLGNLEVKGKCARRFEKLVFFQGEPPHLSCNICQMTSNLKHMELNGKGHSDEFEISPNDLQQLQKLRILRVTEFTGLKKLPELGKITHELRELTLSGCTSIKELPSLISKLRYLRILKMDGCSSFRGLPEDIGSLSSLQELDLSYCEQIEELPESTSKLQYLLKLQMKSCKNLKKLPNDFESLNSLQVLNLRSCDSLKDLPKNFEKFEKLDPFGKEDGFGGAAALLLLPLLICNIL